MRNRSRFDGARRKRLRWLFVLVACAISPAPALQAADPSPGPLFVVGGGLRPDNAPIFRRLIEAAGGVQDCRFVVFPTASRSTAAAERLKSALEMYGVPPERVAVLDIRLENADVSASDPALVRQISECTAAFFTGGDQGRIIAALRHPDGTETPALAALREAWRQGAAIAGSSAGAAMQSETMIAVSGLPDAALDEGMDALDFGLVREPRRRGLLIAQGLGFFTNGVIDQHFSQFRGRLGRLARAAIDEKVRFGFGIDENTVMIVSGQGNLEVLGPGGMTVVDAKDASCEDGPLGCRITGLRVSCMQNGDRFDLDTGQIAVHPAKKEVKPGPNSNRGNHLIADIAGEGAVRHALFMGLAENTARKQVGVMLRYAHTFGHGYRVTFRKTEGTIAWRGVVENVGAHAIQDVDVTFEPILSSLQRPERALPVDLPGGDAATACQALWFRGILLTDEERRLRPEAPITRAELAAALAHAVHLLPPLMESTIAPDVPEDAEWTDDAAMVLEAKLMELDEHGAFRPSDPVTRLEAALAFTRLRQTLQSGTDASPKPMTFEDEADIEPPSREAAATAVSTLLVTTQGDKFRPKDPLLRQEAAQAIYRMLGFPW